MLQFKVGNRTIHIGQLIALPFFWGIPGVMLWVILGQMLLGEIKDQNIVGIIISTLMGLFVISIASGVTYMLCVCGNCKRFFTLELVEYGIVRCTFCGFERSYA